ncbi:hypothetical protein GCM10011514_27260 [Emticicia aquatilis]|uniref:Peptidase S74 domain-containing protein n=1 Tax=Emticicia aquatilis TaxID=1537369 RepID=A0A917DS87_9BACT|nr:tail fiber domain-containing protein [Emticicia aquatilis]GGD61763.1 hypothetical protein GCM10011514_27260 [Emticicia aquatilis]
MKNIRIYLIVLGQYLSLTSFAQSISLTPSNISVNKSGVDDLTIKTSQNPNLSGVRYNGSFDTPTAVINDNTLLDLRAQGFDGSNFVSGATLRFQSTENWTTTTTGTAIYFYTTANGTLSNTERMVINHDGKVGIGTSSPQVELEVVGNGGFGVKSFGNGNSFNSHIFGAKASGSQTTPTASTNDQILARFEGHGHNGSYFEEGARIEIRAKENWQSAENGSEINFYTAPINGDTPLRRMTIAENGNIGINNTAPAHYLEVLADNDDGIAVKRFSGIPTIFGVEAGGNSNIPSASLNDQILMRLGGKGHDGAGFTNAKARIDFRVANNWTSTNTPTAIDFSTTPASTTTPQVQMTLSAPGNLGIGRLPTAGFRLEVEGDAAKNTAGNWSSHSDRRLKTNILYLNSQEMLQKVLNLKGVTYEWNDTKTGTKRPTGIQYGFIAQEIKEVFPTKIKEDPNGYLMTAYGDYDPMFVESIKALKELIDEQKREIELLKNRLSGVEANNKIKTDKMP